MDNPLNNISDTPTRTQAIKKFLLTACVDNCPDLAELYSHDMEVQVNVAQDDGVIVSKEFKGPIGLTYSNDLETWYTFRIPKNAMTEPKYEDRNMNYDLVVHADGIGMTGWDWYNKRSIFVAFDFDSLVNHAEGLSPFELEEVRDKAINIPWVTVRKSTSGSGIHLYVYLDFDEEVSNHTEHAALARAILNKMSSVAGYNFHAKIDTCGHIMWCWHRKMIGTDGLTIIKQGKKLSEIPQNWRDHIEIIKHRSTRVPLITEGVSDTSRQTLENLISERRHIKLDEDHQRIIKALEGTRSWWDSDRNLLVTHTSTLKKVHEELSLKGVFETISATLPGQDHNCFCVPILNGAFIIYRFSTVKESPTWFQDSRGVCYCYYNRHPNLQTLAPLFGGVEKDNGGWLYESLETAMVMLANIGILLECDRALLQRETVVAYHRNGRISVKISRQNNDRADRMQGWEPHKDGTWTRMFTPTKHAPIDFAPRTMGDNDIIRHIVDTNGCDMGWMINAHNNWNAEPLTHIRIAMKSMGYTALEIEHILGKNITHCWTLVHKPFQTEYPGNREWNRGAPQFLYKPSIKEEYKYPHWWKILEHCGNTLNDAVKQNHWCKINGVATGADYLKCWITSLLKFPTRRLPYLFFYGDQNCGKSIFHEAIGLLFSPGYVRADLCLTNPGGFTGELANAVLCVVEETDLNYNKIAYNRIKDWVTSLDMVIHPKGRTPYQIPNTTHWVHCANDRNACPIFPGDTRIVLVEVNDLDPSTLIPKENLIKFLKDEASDFLAEILALELPSSNDRLNIPPVETEEKRVAMRVNRNALQVFLQESCHYVPGATTTVKEFYETFIMNLEPTEISRWTKIRIGKEMPSEYPKGRLKDATWAYGNLSLIEKDPIGPDLMLGENGFLIERKD